MVEEPETRPLITKVWARNFRSIEYAELELGPLTVLVGPNASGKSNLLDILGFLADAARHGLETTLTRRGGIDSIKRKSSTGEVAGPEIGFHYKSSMSTLEYSFALMPRGRGEYRVKWELARIEANGSEVGPFEIELTGKRLTKPNRARLLKRVKSKRTEGGAPASNVADVIRQLIAERDSQDLLLISEESRQGSGLLIMLLSQLTPSEDWPFLRLHQFLEDAKSNLRKVGMYHIFPNSLRDPQKVALSHPLATGGENLVSTLGDMIQKKSGFLTELKDALNYAVPGIRDIRVTRAGSYNVAELKHVRDGGTDRGSWFDLSYESDGTIRLLGMLVALFQEPAPSLICLEEPELAIHPGAMAVLSDTIKEAAQRGQVVVATHSPDLIDRLPIESIRAVTAESGSTKVGKVAEFQLKSVRDGLFLPGELHSMEGLQPASTGE